MAILCYLSYLIQNIAQVFQKTSHTCSVFYKGLSWVKTFFFFNFSVRPFASEKEFKSTVDIVRKFKEGVGRDLHQKLLLRAKSKRNWVCSWALRGLFSWRHAEVLAGLFFIFLQLEEWWLDTAYLEVRIPSQLNVNFGGPGPYLEHFWPPAEGTWLQRASVLTWHTLQYWDLLRT